MDVLPALLTKVLPLYGCIALGFLAAKHWHISSKWISKVLLFALIPLIIIQNLLKAELSETAVIGSIVFLLACAMNVPAFLTGRFVVKDFDKNLLKGGFSYYNIGWFGIPVVMALFGKEQMPLIISAYVGNALYGDTVGYYLLSRTKGLPVGEAVKKVFKIPAIYACVVAILLNMLAVKIPENLEVVGEVISWVVSALGMLIIGITLTEVNFKHVPYKMFGKILSIRYAAGLLLLAAFIGIEKQFIEILDKDQQKLILLLSSFPIAANLVVFAAFLETEKENAALLVGISSIISLLLAPLACLLLF